MRAQGAAGARQSSKGIEGSQQGRGQRIRLWGCDEECLEVTYDHQGYAVPSTCHLYSSTYLSSLLPPTTYPLPVIPNSYLPTYLSSLPTYPICHFYLPSTYLPVILIYTHLPPTYLLPTCHLYLPSSHSPTHPSSMYMSFCGEVGFYLGLRRWGGLLLTEGLGQRC